MVFSKLLYEFCFPVILNGDPVIGTILWLWGGFNKMGGRVGEFEIGIWEQQGRISTFLICFA